MENGQPQLSVHTEHKIQTVDEHARCTGTHMRVHVLCPICRAHLEMTIR